MEEFMVIQFKVFFFSIPLLFSDPVEVSVR